MNSTNEVQIWAGHPSQWVNFRTYVSCLVVFAIGIFAGLNGGNFISYIVAAIAVLIAGWAYLNVRCWSYTLTSERYKYSFGVLSRKFHEIELYRVKDVVLDQPVWLRIVGRANVTVVGFDAVRPIAHLRAIPDGAAVRESFRNLIEKRRDIKSVRVSERG